jgi:GNAT superfamily N-acetyltransferase
MSLLIRAARRIDAPRIVAITNDAFMADAFFKVPEAVLRFKHAEDVEQMIDTPQSQFLLATLPDSTVAGSLYFEYQIDFASVLGKFSAVSVPSSYARRGIGAALVQAVEQRVLELATEHNARECAVEMSVVNVRPDLFAWYGKQGYQVVGPIVPTPPFFSSLVAPSAGDVHLVLMRKQLKVA